MLKRFFRQLDELANKQTLWWIIFLLLGLNMIQFVGSLAYRPSTGGEMITKHYESPELEKIGICWLNITSYQEDFDSLHLVINDKADEVPLEERDLIFFRDWGEPVLENGEKGFFNDWGISVAGAGTQKNAWGFLLGAGKAAPDLEKRIQMRVLQKAYSSCEEQAQN